MLIALATLIGGVNASIPNWFQGNHKSLLMDSEELFAFHEGTLPHRWKFRRQSFAAHLIESLTVPAIIEHFALP